MATMDKHNTIKNAFEVIEELDELIEIEYMEADDDPGCYYECMGVAMRYSKYRDVVRGLLALVMED